MRCRSRSSTCASAGAFASASAARRAPSEHECSGIYTEVVKPKKLVFTWTWPRTTPERESLVTIHFNAKGGGTELVFRHERFFDEKVRDDHQRGWSALLDQLGAYVTKSTI